MTTHYHKQVKSLVYKTFKYFEAIVQGKEDNFAANESKTKLVKRISTISGISKTSILEIIKTGEDSDGNLDVFKRSERSYEAKKTGLDEAQLGAVRSILYNYHQSEGRLVTLKGLCQKVSEEINIQMSTVSMRKVIRKLGFKFNKTKNNRIQLVERPDIKEKRRQFLNKIQFYRSMGRPIIYTDETYVHTYYSTFKAWQDDSAEGFKPKIGKGKRFIIVHAGSETGFVPNGLLCFRSNSDKQDYHGDMNHQNFKKWATEKLLPNLEPHSVIIMDNASYHNTLKNPPPNSSNTKAEILAWLKDKVNF